MAFTEFHDPADAPEGESERFEPRRIAASTESTIISIDVIRSTGLIKLDGISGRRFVTPEGIQQIIDGLQEALDFIEAHPPKAKKDTEW